MPPEDQQESKNNENNNSNDPTTTTTILTGEEEEERQQEEGLLGGDEGDLLNNNNNNNGGIKRQQTKIMLSSDEIINLTTHSNISNNNNNIGGGGGGGSDYDQNQYRTAPESEPAPLPLSSLSHEETNEKEESKGGNSEKATVATTTIMKESPLQMMDGKSKDDDGGYAIDAAADDDDDHTAIIVDIEKASLSRPRISDASSTVDVPPPPKTQLRRCDNVNTRPQEPGAIAIRGITSTTADDDEDDDDTLVVDLESNTININNNGDHTASTTTNNNDDTEGATTRTTPTITTARLVTTGSGDNDSMEMQQQIESKVNEQVQEHINKLTTTAANVQRISTSSSKNNAEDEDSRRRRKKSKLYCGLIVVVLSIIIVVGLVFGVVSKDIDPNLETSEKSSSGLSPSSSSATSSPSVSPTVTPNATLTIVNRKDNNLNNYDYGEEILIEYEFNTDAGYSIKDIAGSHAWIGIFPANVNPYRIPRPAHYWVYACSGNQSPECGEDINNNNDKEHHHPTIGVVKFNTKLITMSCGKWKAYLIPDGGVELFYNAVTFSEKFTIGNITTRATTIIDNIDDDEYVLDCDIGDPSIIQRGYTYSTLLQPQQSPEEEETGTSSSPVVAKQSAFDCAIAGSDHNMDSLFFGFRETNFTGIPCPQDPTKILWMSWLTANPEHTALGHQCFGMRDEKNISWSMVGDTNDTDDSVSFYIGSEEECGQAPLDPLISNIPMDVPTNEDNVHEDDGIGAAFIYTIHHYHTYLFCTPGLQDRSSEFTNLTTTTFVGVPCPEDPTYIRWTLAMTTYPERCGFHRLSFDLYERETFFGSDICGAPPNYINLPMRVPVE